MNFHEPEVVEMGLAKELIHEIPCGAHNLEDPFPPARCYEGVVPYRSPEVVEMGLAEELIQEVPWYPDSEGTINPAKCFSVIAVYCSE